MRSLITKCFYLFLGLLCCVSTGFAADDAFVASKNSDKYHVATCVVAKQIKKESLITFKTPADAEKAGLKPCLKCAGFVIGSKNSTVYHNASCAIGKKISADNLVVFASKEEAEKAAYKPCQVCLSTKKADPAAAPAAPVANVKK